jgi:hypothetical protein
MLDKQRIKVWREWSLVGAMVKMAMATTTTKAGGAMGNGRDNRSGNDERTEKTTRVLLAIFVE